MEQLLMGEVTPPALPAPTEAPAGMGPMERVGRRTKKYLYPALVLVLISITIQRERFGIPVELDGPAVALLAGLVFLTSPSSVFRPKNYPLLLPMAGFVLAGWVSCTVNFGDLSAASRSGSSLASICVRESAILTYRVIMFYTVLMAARFLPESRRKPPVIMLGLLLIQILICLVMLPAYPSPLSQLFIRGEQFGPGSRAFIGLFLEPNLFGVYAVTTVSLWFSIALHLRAKRALICTLVAILIGTIGVFMSYTRSAWLAMFLIFATLAVGVLSRLQLGSENRRKLVWLIVAIILVGFALSIGISLVVDRQAALALISRSGKLIESQAGSGAGRLRVWDAAMREWISKPWFGWGLLSFSAIPWTDGWLYSSVIGTLHDTGIFGLAFMLWVCAGVAWKTWRGYRLADLRIDKGIALGYLAAQAALFFSSQFSSFFWGAPTWAVFGLSVAYGPTAAGVHASGEEGQRLVPGAGEESTAGSGVALRHDPE